MDNDEAYGMENYRPRRRRAAPSSPRRTARGIGWFSVGMGIAQIVAPRLVSRLTGLPFPPGLVVACGVRELVCGIGILTQDQERPWVQARVAGDAVDLAAFGAALLVPGTDRRRLAVATAGVAAVAALDVYCERALAKDRRRRAARHLSMSVHIERPPDELYGFWRELPNLPRVMPRLESVRVLSDSSSRWTLRARSGAPIEWDVELIDDVPGERIAWRSVDGSPVFSAGSVQFLPSAAGGTDVRVDLLYEPAPGSIKTAVSLLFGVDPDEAGRLDLDTLKRDFERGP